MTESIAQIKEALTTIQPGDSRLAVWQKDSRKGVQTALLQWQKRQAKHQSLIDKYLALSIFETDYADRGYHLVAGIDEVGRGPLAGPVVACAVILNPEKPIYGLNDSKQINEQNRNRLAKEIKEKAIAIGIGEVSHTEIDQINIYEATKVAMLKAIEALTPAPQALLIDAMKLATPLPQENLIKGDARSNSIAAASIVAKVYRDDLMKAFAKQYPGYGFDHNAGYGTKEHLAGLEKNGITPIHRRTFAPIKNMLP